MNQVQQLERRVAMLESDQRRVSRIASPAGRGSARPLVVTQGLIRTGVQLDQSLIAKAPEWDQDLEMWIAAPEAIEEQVAVSFSAGAWFPGDLIWAVGNIVPAGTTTNARLHVLGPGRLWMRGELGSITTSRGQESIFAPKQWDADAEEFVAADVDSITVREAGFLSVGLIMQPDGEGNAGAIWEGDIWVITHFDCDKVGAQEDI